MTRKLDGNGIHLQPHPARLCRGNHQTNGGRHRAGMNSVFYLNPNWQATGVNTTKTTHTSHSGQSWLFPPCLTSSAHSTSTPNPTPSLILSHGDDHCDDPRLSAHWLNRNCLQDTKRRTKIQIQQKYRVVRARTHKDKFKFTKMNARNPNTPDNTHRVSRSCQIRDDIVFCARACLCK